MLLRQNCRFGNNVERNFVLLTKSKQIEHVHFVSTLSKKNEISFNIVAKKRQLYESNNATFDFVERIVRLVAFDNVASASLPV